MYNSRHKEAPAGTEATKSEYNGILLNNKNDHRERTAQRKTKILADFDSSLVTQGLKRPGFLGHGILTC